MMVSNLISALVVTTLLIGNVACACAPISVEVPVEHHHHADAHDAHLPCDHEDCDSCLANTESCATSEFAELAADRDSRLPLQPKPIDSDQTDDAYALIEPGPPRASPWPTFVPTLADVSSPRASDTPIQRKDQLTE